ncbi:MAG: phenylalanine--tRNA ligase subunit alpha [Methanospirillaceae archaeon]|nr:phenylalanine--tRNA ligase subunit alpha [Methanospirillaceae archaeon]
MALTYHEKVLLGALSEKGSGTPQELGTAIGRDGDAVLQYGYLLQDRNLASIHRETTVSYTRTDEGEEYNRNGLPERQLYRSFESSIPVAELNTHPLARIGIGWMRRLGWISIADGIITKKNDAPVSDIEKALADPGAADAGNIADLLRRGLISQVESVTYTIGITKEGTKVAAAGLDLTEETGTLSSDQITSGEWKNLSLRRYDIRKPPKPLYPGKIHPYQQLIDQMRRILLEMGFTELHGEIVQSSFWNFDALFQPQDHPAREMQDTFHLAGKMPLPRGWEAVQAMHENGGETSSTGWGRSWDPEKAKATVLRTHTTSLSIQYLASHTKPPVKAFAIGRVYRREAIDPTHTPEFEQLEGIVMDEEVNFRHLMGYLREFYHRMGFSDVRFRPGYFPYTEPSVEPEVYVSGLGWVELGGAGIFRQEVTAPFGIEYPVLAWGLGASRVAMLKMGLKDLRELYQSDIDWIRNTPAGPGNIRAGLRVQPAMDTDKDREEH